jgi:hypothetical protein
VLSKIFCLKDNDPLIWQDSYLDSEVTKLLEYRDRQQAQEMNKY